MTYQRTKILNLNNWNRMYKCVENKHPWVSPPLQTGPLQRNCKDSNPCYIFIVLQLGFGHSVSLYHIC